MEIKILENWKEIIDIHFRNVSDVFLAEEYCKCFQAASADVVCEAFFYKNDSFVFLLPYLKKVIPGTEFFDFETVYGYSGPLVSEDNLHELEIAWDNFKALGMKQKLVAGLIRFNPFLKNAQEVKSVKLIYDRDIVAIDLSQSEDDLLFKSIHHKHRNAINKTKRCNVQFLEDKSFSFYSKFQDLYSKTMERVGAQSFYLFDESFFKNLKNNLKDDLLLYGVLSDGELVSACLVLKRGELAHYFLSASDEKYWDLSPNTFMVFETALALKKLGIKEFNLGGGYSNNEDSLFKFKQRFSKISLPFFIGKIILNQVVYENLIKEWETKVNDQHKEKYKNFLMKYRF